MRIVEIRENKKQYLDLLLLADEQEDMIDRYLERGRMFALFDDDLKTVCVVTDEGDGLCELKNIATYEHAQRKGYGKRMVEHVLNEYRATHDYIDVGTGDSPLTVPFYEACGFTLHHRIKNFFTDNYDHPIFECGKQLVDMVVLRQSLNHDRLK